MQPDRILDLFEAEWAAGDVPRVPEYLALLRVKNDAATACELLKIDLERRWRHADARIPRWTLENYLQNSQLALSEPELMDLICWEYFVRNRWGDCPTRTEMGSRFSRLSPALDALLKLIAAEIPWPKLVLTMNHQVLSEIALDGPVEVGRQKEHDPAPFALVQQSEPMRLIVAAAKNPAISREQLRIRLKTPNSIQLINTSRNRAVAICACDALDAGKTRVYELPVRIHLFEEKFLHISIGPSLGVCGREKGLSVDL